MGVASMHGQVGQAHTHTLARVSGGSLTVAAMRDMTRSGSPGMVPACRKLSPQRTAYIPCQYPHIQRRNCSVAYPSRVTLLTTAAAWSWPTSRSASHRFMAPRTASTHATTSATGKGSNDAHASAESPPLFAMARKGSLRLKAAGASASAALTSGTRHGDRTDARRQQEAPRQQRAATCS